MKIQRLFDFLEYQLQTNPVNDALCSKINGSWKKYSTQDVVSTVNSLAAGLLKLGISSNDMTTENRDKIGIISANRPEWLMVDLAVQKIGSVLVPVYPTVTASELEFIMNEAQVKIIFAGDKNLLQKVLSIKNNIPSLQHCFTFENVDGEPNWKDVLQETTPENILQIQQESDKVKPEHLATIIYTSGTTGTPKGVMLSHNNVVSNILDSNCIFIEIGIKNARTISFLPLNHIFERVVSYIYFYNSVSIYYAESMETVGENIKEVQPTVFGTVPRLLEKVYEKIVAKGAALTGIKKKLFDWALQLGLQYDQNNRSWSYNFQLAIANKLIFNKWREALGGNVKAIVTGAAACQVKLLRVFSAAQIPILEGYGLTETSPVISVNRFNNADRKFGTVGTQIKNIEVKIADDGEILCKGPNVMMGYYKRPDLTSDCIKDGWFHTGDIGTFEDGKFLKITDRKKEIFKTSGGKYVAPQPIENKMKESQWIEQMMVVGSEQKFAGALIVPSFKALQGWCKENGIEFSSNDAIIKNEKVVDLIKETVAHYNKNINQVEQIKRFELLPKEWSTDGGELTPTLKLKRKVITEKYSDAINKIYSV